MLMAAMEPHRQALSRRAAESDKGKRRRRDCDAAVAADALVEMARSRGLRQPADPAAADAGGDDPRAGRSRGHGAGTHEAGRGVRGAGSGTGHRGLGPEPAGRCGGGRPAGRGRRGAQGRPPGPVHPGQGEDGPRRAGPGAAWCRAVPSTATWRSTTSGPSPPAGAASWPTCAGCAGSTTTSRPTTAGASPEQGKRWLWEGPHGPPPDPNARQPELAAARVLARGLARAPTPPDPMPANPSWPRPASKSRARVGSRTAHGHADGAAGSTSTAGWRCA